VEFSILGQHFERSKVMRKVCGFCLAVALGVGLGRMSSGRIQEAEAGGGSSLPSCSATNGDVNADGNVDVSDAIAVVQFLFLGEPELLQPICPTGLPSPLPTPGRFVDNGDGTVTDEDTGLMWEKNVVLIFPVGRPQSRIARIWNWAATMIGECRIFWSSRL
jgi:hypothetical protein